MMLDCCLGEVGPGTPRPRPATSLGRPAHPTPWVAFLHGRGCVAPAGPLPTSLRPWGSPPEKGLLGLLFPRPCERGGGRGGLAAHQSAYELRAKVRGSVTVPESRALKAPEMGVTPDVPGPRRPHRPSEAENFLHWRPKGSKRLEARVGLRVCGR